MTSRDPREDNLVSSVVDKVRHRVAAQEAARDGVLASDADRDAATRLLSDAFATGRLSSADLDQRTTGALAARTHGELDDLLAGLGGYRTARKKKHPVRKAIFGVVAFVASPFVLIASLLTFFGTDADDHVGGLVLLVVLVPGLVALWRWAWPRA